jgi:hypothetical protein
LFLEKGQGFMVVDLFIEIINTFGKILREKGNAIPLSTNAEK